MTRPARLGRAHAGAEVVPPGHAGQLVDSYLAEVAATLLATGPLIGLLWAATAITCTGGLPPHARQRLAGSQPDSSAACRLRRRRASSIP
jgi:hypothetical protein